MSSPNRGDIYWINLDPTIGAEIKKTRPCVIISPDAANQSGPLVIVAPITKAEGKKVHFHEILLPKESSTLQYNSKIKVFQLRCVDKKRLSKSKIGSISMYLIKELDEKIRIVTGLY
ncbi:MAG: type II toxin-antitoxin system PemK/MazF family toxin [Deltaproteobacteria bacterium]|nr:type II toxin-antitoxin system PemK/MazF family toxin [Deltaproteobacteria bacterium]